MKTKKKNTKNTKKKKKLSSSSQIKYEVGEPDRYDKTAWSVLPFAIFTPG